MLVVPFWTDDIATRREDSPAGLPDSADVAVIGGGYTGLHAALALAKAGATVVVLEGHAIGWGASSRNGGMLNPGLKLSAPALQKRYGDDMARRLWRWSLRAIDFVEHFVAAEHIACDFTRSGQLVLAHKPQHFAAMHDEVLWHASHLDDPVPAPIGPSELAAEIGTRAYFGAVYDPRAAGLHPAKYVDGLAGVARARGVLLVEDTPVNAILRDRSGFELATGRGVLRAGNLLLATNGYTTGLLPEATRHVFPGGSYIITTAPLSADLRSALMPRNRMCYDSKHFLNYFRLTSDGRMLFGGRHNLSTDLDLVVSAAELRTRMVEVFPELHDVDISHSWSGRLGLTFDLMPHVGRFTAGAHVGAFFALGYGGHGVAVASFLGNTVGRLIAGQPVDCPLLELVQNRHFLTPYARYYLPLVSAWFRILDRVS